jgi:hypothetical protein
LHAAASVTSAAPQAAIVVAELPLPVAAMLAVQVTALWASHAAAVPYSVWSVPGAQADR